MAPRDDADLARLGGLAKARRVELGLGIKKAAAQAGISKETWSRLESGRPLRDLSYQKIERVLGWAAGSCTLVLDGGEPIAVEASQAAPDVTLAEVPSPELTDAMELSVQRASIGVVELNAEQIQEMSRRVVDDLKRRGII